MGITAASLALALLATGAPEHPHGLYVKLSGLYVDQQDSDISDPGGGPAATTLTFNSGYGVVAGLGYTFSLELPISLSVELEYAFRSSDASSFENSLATIGAVGTYDSHSVMVNAIASLDISNGFGLYGGVGVGTTVTTADLAADLGLFLLDVPTENDTTFTWQVLGGAQYVIGNHLMLYAGVRYFDAGTPDLDLIGSSNASFAAEAGLRVYF